MNPQDIISEALEQIYKHIGIDPDTTVEAAGDDVFNVEINGDDLNFLIGFRGYSLDGLQNILRQITFKKAEKPVFITVDINGYRKRRIEKLLDRARDFIDKVRFFEKEVELPPMDPWERRQIHMFVSEYEDIDSESTGEGRNRRVVLKPHEV